MILPNKVVPKDLDTFIIAVAEMVNEVCLSIWIFGYEKTPCDRHFVWLIHILHVYSYQNIIFFTVFCIILCHKYMGYTIPCLIIRNTGHLRHK